MKFTSRDLSLKRTPSKKQSGVFGVKINVVTKCVRSLCRRPLRAQQPLNMKDGVAHLCCREINATSGSVCRRERSKVPYIVRQCIEEVEKRGIDEVGIYRISGVATDIQALKSVFDTSKNPTSCLLTENTWRTLNLRGSLFDSCSASTSFKIINRLWLSR